MQCHLQSKNGIYFVPGSAGEHSPQTFTLVGGGGQGVLQTSWKIGDRMGTNGALWLGPPAPAPSGGTTLLLLWCKVLWECPSPSHLGKSKFYLSLAVLCVFLLPGRYLGFCTAVGWGCCSGVCGRPLVERMAGQVGSRT